MAPAEANAKMVVATSRGDCKGLKDMVQRQDATTMLVVMASSNLASEEKPSPPSMHPLLAAVSCRGSWEELTFLLNREGPQAQPSENISEEFRHLVVAYYSSNGANRSSAMQQTTADVEEGINAASLLEGVTVEGNTALHMVAANGDGQNFLDCADLLYEKDRGLLSKQNTKGDTPLHCASRSGNSQMVRHLIDLARHDNIVINLLRQENNSKETVLHEAIRNQDNQLIKVLLAADKSLACFPQEGTSPLYLAILLKANHVVQMLCHDNKKYVLSSSGPNGQNVLHAAVLRDPELTRKVLDWNTNKDLTTGRDVNGSTPLHFAAGILWASQQGSVCSQVFKANRAALYQPDNVGLYPIHVAASVGSEEAIAMFVKKCPRIAGLRDAKGRTFVHVAVEKKKMRVVNYACRNPLLAWVLNMQDNDGNTALHLAIRAGSIRMFCALFGNQKVHMSLTNAEGQTPLDIARYKIPPGMHYNQNSEARILCVFLTANTWIGTLRQDHYWEKYGDIYADYEIKLLEHLKDSTQTLCIGPVLVATVTFGSTFALPGGYRADDHPNGGTPTLAGRYAFDAFMVANTIAFVCSSIATVCFMYSGSPLFHLVSRKIYFATSFYLWKVSITALTTAFALGVYMVLGPVAHKTAIGICVLSALVVLSNKVEFCWKWTLLLRPLCIRMGLIWTFGRYTRVVLETILIHFWPLMVTFGWAAYASSYRVS